MLLFVLKTRKTIVDDIGQVLISVSLVCLYYERFF